MRLGLKIFLGIILLTFYSCGQKQNSDLLIINEIFPELINKIYIIRLNPPPPPPPPPIMDENDSIIGYDTTGYRAFIDKYNSDVKKMKIDTNNIVVAISDSLFPYQENDIDYIKRELPSSSYNEAINSTLDNKYKSIWIDLTRLANTKNIELKYLSEFPKGMDIWDTDYDFNFSGILRISRIYFDSSGLYGVFYCSYTCGGLCGHGDIVCIKKEDGIWKIEKTIGLWIS